MFKENNYITEPKEEKVVVNMVMTITTKSKLLEMVAFKEKKTLENEDCSRLDWGKKIQKTFEVTIQEIQEKEPPL